MTFAANASHNNNGPGHTSREAHHALSRRLHNIANRISPGFNLESTVYHSLIILSDSISYQFQVICQEPFSPSH